MPDLRSGVSVLQRAWPDQVLLGAQRTLEEYRLVEVFVKGAAMCDSLRFHDDGEFSHVMLDAPGVAFAYARLAEAAAFRLYALCEILSECAASSVGDFIRQCDDVALDGTEVFVSCAVGLGVLARTLESATLGDVVKRTSEDERRDLSGRGVCAVGVGIGNIS